MTPATRKRYAKIYEAIECMEPKMTVPMPKAVVGMCLGSMWRGLHALLLGWDPPLKEAARIAWNAIPVGIRKEEA